MPLSYALTILLAAATGALLRYRIDALLTGVRIFCAHHTGRHTRRGLATSTTETTEAGTPCATTSN